MHETARMPADEAGRSTEQLVALRPDVLSDVEHAVGNLLQRMHHAARTARGATGVPDDRLQGALADLERLLDLLFDYVTPVDVQARPIAADRVAESLASQVRGQGAVEVNCETLDGAAVLADLRALSRSFHLLTQGCGGDWASAGQVSIGMAHDGDLHRVLFTIRTGAELAPQASAQGSLATAVAARLLEVQGGELRQRPYPGCVCIVVLPAAG